MGIVEMYAKLLPQLLYFNLQLLCGLSFMKNDLLWSQLSGNILKINSLKVFN